MSSEQERITNLEISLAHLQRQYDMLNEVVIEQTRELERATKQIAKWENEVNSMKNQMESPGDPLDEKPPHY
ncbi:MAG: SlyX family protein [Planctomycetota bacterium]